MENVLYKIQFNKKFFGSIENIIKAYPEHVFLDFKESRSVIIGIVFDTTEFKIIKRYEPVLYNKFTKFFYIDVE